MAKEEDLMGLLPDEIRQNVLGNLIYDEDERKHVVQKFMDNFKEADEQTGGYNKLTVIHLHRFKNKSQKPERKFSHKTKTLSYRQRKQLGFNTITKNSVKYKDLIPLHELWKDYMRECLNLDDLRKQGKKFDSDENSVTQTSIKLFRADYHGCKMKVERSVCPSYVGKSGILAMETRHCFRLLGEDNKVRTIPKGTCTFSFQLDEFSFSFFGKNFTYRPADRITKRVKTILPSDL